MNDSTLMDVLKSWQQLLHNSDGLGFLESFSFDDVVEKLASLGVFHDEVDIGAGFYDLGGRGGTS